MTHPTPQRPHLAEIQPLEPRALFSVVALSDVASAPADSSPDATYVPHLAEGSLYSGSRGDSNRLSD